MTRRHSPLQMVKEAKQIARDHGCFVGYAHPDDYTLTWTGRGKKPAWVTAWIDQGNALEELEVAQQAARASSKTDQEEEENSGRDAAGGMEHGASTAEDMEQAA